VTGLSRGGPTANSSVFFRVPEGGRAAAIEEKSSEAISFVGTNSDFLFFPETVLAGKIKEVGEMEEDMDFFNFSPEPDVTTDGTGAFSIVPLLTVSETGETGVWRTGAGRLSP
jgi:hypothetical protein